MKKFLFIILVSFAVAACNNNSDKTENKTDAVKTDSVKKDSVKVAEMFQCPMHPEVTSNEPGTCTKCGMELEKK